MVNLFLFLGLVTSLVVGTIASILALNLIETNNRKKDSLRRELGKIISKTIEHKNDVIPGEKPIKQDKKPCKPKTKSPKQVKLPRPFKNKQ